MDTIFYVLENIHDNFNLIFLISEKCVSFKVPFLVFLSFGL